MHEIVGGGLLADAFMRAPARRTDGLGGELALPSFIGERNRGLTRISNNVPYLPTISGLRSP